MTRHDHKNKDPEKASYHSDEARPCQTVRVLGTEIEPAQFSIVFFCVAPLALVYQFGVFESAGLNSLQTVAIVAPLVLMVLLLAFTRIDGHLGGSYLHMALTEKLASRDRQRRLGEREDERD